MQSTTQINYITIHNYKHKFMNTLTRIGYKYFLRLTNTSYKALASNQPNSDYDTFRSNQQLQSLAQKIYKMRTREQKYLNWKFDELALQDQKSLFLQNIDTSAIDDTIDPRSYFLQQKYIQEEWGAPNSLVNIIFKAQAQGTGGEQGAAEVKKKDIYDVQLTSVNASDKIKIIKVIRQLMNLGLKEAKELVEKTPVVLKQAKKQQADELAQKLIAAGCNINVK